MSTFTENDHPADDGATRRGAGSVQRRTIVQGAAWTIPVVAMAAATPAAAASQQPSVDVAVNRVVVGRQDTLDLPQGPVGPDYGMFVDIQVINNGPDAVTGLRIDGDFAAVFTNDDGTDTTRIPYITDGRWVSSGGTQYTNPALGDASIRSVFFFTRPDITLQPGEATTVRMYFWTKRIIATQGTVNVVGRVSLLSGTDTNAANNEAASQLYTVTPTP